MKRTINEKISVYKRPESSLTPKQKSLRKRSLDVVRDSRNTGYSLSKIAKEYKISVNSVIHNTNAFKKINGRWVAKKYDKVPRVMKISENGKEISFENSDSRIAATIAKYHGAVKEFLNTGKIDKLSKFKYKKIKDSQGNYHKFETNLQSILDIEQRKESPEFYTVYVT